MHRPLLDRLLTCSPQTGGNIHQFVDTSNSNWMILQDRLDALYGASDLLPDVIQYFADLLDVKINWPSDVITRYFT